MELRPALVLISIAVCNDEMLTSATAAGLPDGFGSDLITACDVISRAAAKGDLGRAGDAGGQKLVDAILNLEAL